MNRSLLAIASALLVAPALFATGAQACISCEYTPEVVKGSQTSDAPRYYAREHVYAVERSAPVKKHIVRSEPVAKNVDTADEAPVAKQAKSEQAKNENSSISSAAEVATAEPAKVEVKAASNENSSISVNKPAATEKVAAADPAPAKDVSAKATDCKKFFATVGLTLSVPCE